MKQSSCLASLSLVFILGTPVLNVAQTKPKSPRKKPDPRLARAQSITDDLIKDATALELADRALLWMRLGEIWKRTDPERAATWFKKAVNELEVAPPDESGAARAQRVATARALLSIVAPFDKELATRLTAIFTEESARQEEGDRAENAKALANAAYQVIDTDPKLAAKLASASLRWGKEGDVSSLLLKLRKRDPQVADGLFSEMLATAARTHDKELLWNLVSVAFKAPLEPQWIGLAPPDNLSQNLLTVVAETLRQTSSADTPDCMFVSSIAAPLLSQFDRLAPAQAPIVRQELNKCQSMRSPSEEQPAVQDSGKQQTIDEMVEEANKIPNPILRAVTLVRVANQAASQKKYDIAIEILNGIEAEVPPFLRGPWQGWRAEWAALSALDHLKTGDRTGMQQVINAVPANLRAQTQIMLAEKLDAKERNLAIELLLEGQKFLARDDVSNRLKADWYPVLVRLSAKYIPSQAPAMLNEAVKILNRVESTEPAKKGAPEGAIDAAANYLWRPIDLAGSLIDIDENGVRYSVSQLESPVLRAQARLGLLVSTLDKLDSAAPAK